MNELISWWRGLSVPQRHRLIAFPVADLERTVWLCSVWEVLLHKLPDLLSGEPAASNRVACVNGYVQLGSQLAVAPEEAIHAMQNARLRDLEWSPESGEGLEAAKQRLVEQLALTMLQQRMVEAHKRDSQMEDAERMALQLIAEEEESKARLASKAKKNAKKKQKKKGKGGGGKDKEEDDEDEEEAIDDGDKDGNANGASVALAVDVVVAATAPSSTAASAPTTSISPFAAAAAAAATRAKPVDTKADIPRDGAKGIGPAAATVAGGGGSGSKTKGGGDLSGTTTPAVAPKPVAAAGLSSQGKAGVASTRPVAASTKADAAVPPPASVKDATVMCGTAGAGDRSTEEGAWTVASSKSHGQSRGATAKGKHATHAETRTAAALPAASATTTAAAAAVGSTAAESGGGAATGTGTGPALGTVTGTVTGTGTGTGTGGGGGGGSGGPPAAGTEAAGSRKAQTPLDPAMVERLRDMTGAPPKRCEEALRLHNGNADSAALWLLLDASERGATPAVDAAGRGGMKPAAIGVPGAASQLSAQRPASAPVGGAQPAAVSTPKGATIGRDMSSAASSGGSGSIGGKAEGSSKPPSPSASCTVAVPSSGGGGASSPASASTPPRSPPLPLVADSAGFDGLELMGVVRDTPPGKPYGFISVWHHNVTLFYHYNDVQPAAKDQVKRHTAVAFTMASWSQGFKAERVRPLSAAEQKLGAKDSRMALLRATVRKWSSSEGSGTLQLASQPCSLPFHAMAPLSSRLQVGTALVCKIDGKGKDLLAVHLQMPPPAAASGAAPAVISSSERGTTRAEPTSGAAARGRAAGTASGAGAGGAGAGGAGSGGGGKSVDECDSVASGAEVRASAAAGISAASAVASADDERSRPPLSANRERGVPPVTSSKSLPGAATLATWPPPGIGLAAGAAANAVDSSGSTSSSPTAHLPGDRPSLASQPPGSHGMGGVAALLGGLPKAQPNKPSPPPGLGGLPGLPMAPNVPKPATVHAAAPTSAALPGLANGTSKAGASATAALNETAATPLGSQPPLAWPSLPSALHDVFGNTPAGGSANPAPPRANANTTDLHPMPAAPPPSRPVPMAPPLFPGFGGAVAGGTDWGAAAFGNGVFGGTPLGAAQPPPAGRTQSLPVPSMPPSLFPFNAAGWSGGGGDGWGTAAGAPLGSGAPHAALTAEPNTTWPGAAPLVGDPSQARKKPSGGGTAGGNYSLF